MSTITPERLSQMIDGGVTLASIELLEQMEGKQSPLVRLKAERNDDGTWRLLVTRVYDCPNCGEPLPPAEP